MRIGFRVFTTVLVVLVGLVPDAAAEVIAQDPPAASISVGALEPNNSFGSASPIAATGTVQETIYPQYDVDWFRLVVDRHGELKVSITNVAQELDIAVRLWNADYRAISDWVRPLAQGGDTNAVFDLPSGGRFYLEVRDGGDNAQSAQPYQLATVFTPAIDPAEPNNTVGSATPLAVNTPLQATILPVGDVDFYRIQVPHHGELQIAITEVPAEMEMIVRVWNANVNTISGWFAPLARGGDTLASFDLAEPGVYYLEVRDKDDNARSTQPYTVQANFLPAADSFEPNNEIGRASPLAFDTAVHANILPMRDVDWFVVSVDHHGELTVRISEVDPELDMIFRVWNANNQAISNWYAPLAKGGDTEGVYDLPGPGRYYLEIRDKDDNGRSIQPYSLTASFIPAVDPFEPNNSFGYASEIGTDRTVQANILPRGDSDWYGMQFDHHGELQVTVSNVPEDMDIVFRLWNSDVQAITSWYSPLAKGGNTEGAIDVAQPGYYVLEVRDGGDDARNVQPYTLSTRFLTAADPHEPNQTLDTAAPVALDQTIAGNILPLRDVDWYAVDIPVSGDLHVLVTNVAPELDIVVRVWSSTPSAISSWQGPLARGGNTEVTVAIAEPGLYMLELRDGNDDARSIQPYLLRMSMQPIDPATMVLPQPAAPAATTAPAPGSTPPTTPAETEAVAADQGKVRVRVSGQVGPIGGELFVQEPFDPAVDGARLEVPPDMLDEFATISIATVELPPPDAPFGLFPAGPYWEFTPSGLQFKEPVTVTLPAPPSVVDEEVFIGHWTGNEWVDLGGTVENGLITTLTPGFSIYAVFCGKLDDYRPVTFRNDSSSPSVHLTYVAGPVPDPDAPDEASTGCPATPSGDHRWEIDQGKTTAYRLRPGLYHFMVSYPQPQPGVANSLFLKVTPGEQPLAITIGDQGADSSDPGTAITFAGNQVVAGSNLRPHVAGAAAVPPGIALVSADPTTAALPSQVVVIGPIKLEQLPPKGPGIALSAVATDPEGSPLRAIWTLNDGNSHRVVAGETVASGAEIAEPFAFRPHYAGTYTIFLTVYDDLGLFNEMRWVVTVEANARPEIRVVSGRTHVEFGRLDMERYGGVGDIAPLAATVRPGTPVPVAVSSLITPGESIDWTPLSLCPSVLYGPFDTMPDPYSVVNTPTPVDALLPVAAPDVTNRWVNPGRTCVWALVRDTDDDPLAVTWEMPVPLFGEGTIYAAVDVPAGFHPKAPDGIRRGALLATYSSLEAYNVWISTLFEVAGVVPAIVWEAWDDPCLGGGGEMISPCPSAIARGGLTNLVARVTDGFVLPPRLGYTQVLVGPEAFDPDCANVLFFSELRPNPSDPAPLESVWVTAILSPRAEACPVNFEIIGTDNYRNTATVWTNKDGEASFYIPGGAEDVVDVVTAVVCVPISPLATPPSADEACETASNEPGRKLQIRVTYKF